jgi:hypothetical protein
MTIPAEHPTREQTIPPLLLELVMGTGAVYGAIRVLSDARAFGVRESWLRGGIFSDYTIPGILLLLVIGGGMLAAAGAALERSRFTMPTAAAMGATLLVFLGVEVLIVGYHGAAQGGLLAFCSGSGAALVAVGLHGMRASPAREAGPQAGSRALANPR